MVGIAEIFATLWLMGFTLIAIIGYIRGDFSLSTVGIAAVFLAMIFTSGRLMGILDTIFELTAAPVQQILAEFGIFTTQLVSGGIGMVIVVILFFKFLEVVDPRRLFSMTEKSENKEDYSKSEKANKSDSESKRPPG